MSRIAKLKEWILFPLENNPRFWVKLLYGNIWCLRDYVHTKRLAKTNVPKSCKKGGWKLVLYNSYFKSLGSFIGIDAVLDSKPIFPHGPLGIFISNGSHIGKNCVMFQQVTIGSNTLEGSKRLGSPSIGDNVYMGCGAKVIGKVTVGNNARIGANSIVVKDVPDNSVTIIRSIETIIHNEELNNEFVPIVPDIK